MIGIGIGVSILVGQHLGADRADLAERSTHSGFKMTFLYMAAIAICYVTVPDLFINPFATRTHADGFIEIHRIAVILLRFVAFYSLFDGMSIIYSSALKGAGDTRYIMAAIGVLSFSVLVLPAYIALVVLRAGLYTGWLIATTYVVLLAFLFFLRFRTGRWKTMRVIEPMAIVAPCKETI